MQYTGHSRLLSADHSCEAQRAVCAGEAHSNGDASSTGRVNPLDVPLGGGRSRYSAVVLDSEGIAADGALRDCCVFVVPQVRPSYILLWKSTL